MRAKKLTVEIIAALLVLMFLYASSVKLLNLKVFILDMRNQPFPDWTTSYLVTIVLSVEILIVILLLFEKTRLMALKISAIVLAVFTGYIILIQYNFFGRIPCSCGGIIKGFTWWQHFFFNLFFLAISIAGILLKRTFKQSSQKHFFRV